MISAYTKQKVLDTADVYDVLSEFLELKKVGNRYQCCCPFHQERSPSFSVNPARNRWHCFGCGEDGDTISFLMKRQNMGFSDALVWLAKRYHIEIKYDRSERSEAELEAAKKREAMLIAIDGVQKFFVEQLYADTPEAEVARQYAFSRWGEDFCKENGIGYALRVSATLLDYIAKKGLSMPLLYEIGIVANGEKGDYAFFRERITIPIRDRWGKTIAFTARYIGSDHDKAKYFNSRASSIFQKDETLFGFDIAKKKVKSSNSFIIVEGAPDVLRMQAIGLTEAVAPLGTALTPKHLQELRTQCKTVRFIPDSDPPKGAVHGAGVAAVMKNGTLAMQNGFNVFVREIPGQRKNPVGAECP